MKISIRLIKSRIPLILTPTIPKTMPAMALPIGRERLLKAIANMPQAMDIAAPMHPGSKKKKETINDTALIDVETIPVVMEPIASPLCLFSISILLHKKCVFPPLVCIYFSKRKEVSQESFYNTKKKREEIVEFKYNISIKRGYL